MSTGNAKDIRKQVRNVVQEVLPELLKTEVFKGLYEALQKDMLSKLGIIQENVQQSLKTIDDRSKDLQSYILYQVEQQLAQNAPKVQAQEHTSESNTLAPSEAK